jgi:hypothetical protein
MKSENKVCNTQDNCIEVSIKESTLLPNNRLAQALRWSGAFIISISAITFLLQSPISSWPSGRLIGFLGFIVTLGLCGFLSGLKIREQKAARIFLGLGAVLVFVAWTQLGGLGYASFYAEVSWMPKIFKFEKIALLDFSLLVLLTTFISTLIYWASFSVLIRSNRLKVSQLALLISLVLLLPMRDSALTAFSVIGLWYLIKKLIIETRVQLNRKLIWEELFAFLALTVPLAIMLGRSFTHGTGHPVVILITCALSKWFLFDDLNSIGVNNKCIRFKLLGLFFSLLFWLLLTDMLFFNNLNCDYRWYLTPLGVFPKWTFSLIAVYPYCFALYLYGKKNLALVDDNKNSIGYDFLKNTALILAWHIAAIEVLTQISTPTTIMSILVGLVWIIEGYKIKRNWFIIMGFLVLLIGLINHLHIAVTFLSMSPWLSLGAVGVFIVFLSIYFEGRKVN